MPLPTFVIAGAQKSGTTTLHDWLGQTSGVWVSDPKELHYFERRARPPLSWYADQFTPGPTDVAWGESTPIYLYRDAARAAMAEALPEARFVVVLREPVSRAYSHYWFARSKGAEPLDSFEAAVEAEPQRLSAHPDGQPAKGSYLDRGHYHRQVSDLFERVGRERVLVLLLDDLRLDPLGALRSVAAFVGLPYASLEHVELRATNTFGARTVNVEKGSRVASRTEATPTDAYPPIDPGLEHDLRQVFAADNTRLAALIHRDLRAWS